MEELADKRLEAGTLLDVHRRNTRLADDVRTLNAEIDALRREKNTPLAALEEQVRSLTAAVEAYRALADRVRQLEDEVRTLKGEIDECRRDNLRIAELYDLTVERLGAPDAVDVSSPIGVPHALGVPDPA